MAPVITVIRTAPKSLAAGFFLSVGPNVATYVPSVYALTYIADNVGMAAAVGTIGLLIANVIKLATLPFSGWLSDRFGRKPVFISGAVLCAVAAFPMFWLMDTANALAIWFAMVLVLTFATDLMLGSQAAMLAEQFETKVRYTGVAFCREIAAALAGGTLPFMAAFLNERTHGTWSISLLMIIMCVIAIGGCLATKERGHISFVEEPNRPVAVT